jgi:hypothetical protein
MLCLPLEFEAELLIEFLHFFDLPLHGEAILFEDVILNLPLFGLIKLQRGLQFVDDVVLLSHLLGQHLQTLLLLFALHFLPAEVLFDLLV